MFVLDWFLRSFFSCRGVFLFWGFSPSCSTCSPNKPCPRDPGSPLSDDDDWGEKNHLSQVFRLHETILSFGDPGSLAVQTTCSAESLNHHGGGARAARGSRRLKRRLVGWLVDFV